MLSEKDIGQILHRINLDFFKEHPCPVLDTPQKKLDYTLQKSFKKGMAFAYKTALEGPPRYSVDELFKIIWSPEGRSFADVISIEKFPQWLKNNPERVKKILEGK